MDHRTFLAAVSGGGILLGLFVAALFMHGREKRDAEADAILALIMVLCSLNIAHALLGVSWNAPAGTLRAVIIEPFLFMLPPAVAAYARVLTGLKRRFAPKDLVHALPFLSVSAILLSPIGSKPMSEMALKTASIVVWAGLVVQGIAYSLPIHALVRRHRNSIEKERSDLAGLDLGWLVWLSRAMAILYAAYALVLVAMLHLPQAIVAVRPALSVLLSAVVFVLGYRGLFQRRLIESGSAAIEEEGSPGRPAPKYEKVALTPAEALELARHADQLMEGERLYLEPDLDLAGLARRLGAPRNQVSYALNGIRGTSFYDYVNGYRVREAMRLLREGGPDGPKLLAVALDSGFSSKATFNAVFKKLTGLTPSRFRDSPTDENA